MSLKKLLFVLAVPLTACVNHQVSGLTPIPARTDLATVPEAPSKGQVLLLADNQQTLITTEGVFEQSQLAEAFAGTAHRKPALEMFALDVMSGIVERTQPRLIVHAGDILNNSCKREFTDVAAAFNGYRNENGERVPWFVAPGNHDGYYLGISSPLVVSRRAGVLRALTLRNLALDERAGWNQSCTPVSEKQAGKSFGFSGNIAKNYATYHEGIADKKTFNDLYLRQLGVARLDRQGRSKTVRKLSFDGQSYALRCLEGQPDDGMHWRYLKNVCWTDKLTNPCHIDGLKKQQPNTDKECLPNGFNALKGRVLDNQLPDQYVEAHPWHNFVVQRLVLPEPRGALGVSTLEAGGLEIIILDTSSYGDKEKSNSPLDKLGLRTGLLSEGAAFHGHLQLAQRQLVQQWVKESQKPIILVGHHPLIDFDTESYDFIQELFQTGRIIRYVSGDTHDGYEVDFQRTADRSLHPVSETNLGALIDAPIEYALLDTTGKPNIQRYTLTPMKGPQEPVINLKKLRRPGAKPGKRDVYSFFADVKKNKLFKKVSNRRPRPGAKRTINYMAKDYARFDQGIWEGVCERNWPEFSYSQTPAQRLGLNPLRRQKGLISPLAKLTLQRPSDYLGITHIAQPFTIVELHKRSVNAYKSNRLIAMIEVWRKLYDDAGVIPEQSLLEEEQSIAGSIKTLNQRRALAYWVKSKNRCELISKNKQPEPAACKDEFFETLRRLTGLLSKYQASLKAVPALNTARSKAFRMCSALYEAEREYYH